MFKNFAALKTELGHRIKRPAMADSRKGDFLNYAQDEIAQQFDLKHLKEFVDFTATSDLRTAYILANYLNVFQIMDLTNDLELRERTDTHLTSYDPDFSETGTPYYYSIGERREAKGDPTAASTVDIVSSSASDVAVKVRVQGYVSGVRRSELITLTGKTEATGSLSFSFPLIGIKKDTTSVGVVTVTDTTSTTTLSEIAPSDLVTEYQAVHFYPIPSSSTSMRARIYRAPIRMVEDEDSPDMPLIFHEGLLIRATIKGLRDTWGFKEANAYEIAEWAPYLKRLKKYDRPRGTRAPVIGRGRRTTPITNLPPEYPAY